MSKKSSNHRSPNKVNYFAIGLLVVNLVIIAGILLTIQKSTQSGDIRSRASNLTDAVTGCASGACKPAGGSCCSNSNSVASSSCTSGSACVLKCSNNGSLYSLGSQTDVNGVCKQCVHIPYFSYDTYNGVWLQFAPGACGTDGSTIVNTENANLGCGQVCTYDHQCAGGMQCKDIGGGIHPECWSSTKCGGGTDKMIRINGRITNCSGTTGLSGVKVKAFGNTTTTDSNGFWYITKGGTYYGSTSIVVGKDAGGTDYYTRVATPFFNRDFTCTDINCNYKPWGTSLPYREAYYIPYSGVNGFTKTEFDAFFKTASKTQWVVAFNFRSTNCTSVPK